MGFLYIRGAPTRWEVHHPSKSLDSQNECRRGMESLKITPLSQGIPLLSGDLEGSDSHP